ncbi:MAG TPA: aromatic amino acid transport family protein [Aquella sp.]|nr:aromatic amino acid transport family protein [Aquella sp.]
MFNKSFIGNVFMISGCAMGSGCLAMPMLAAGPNFIFSSIFLILTGFFSYFLAAVSLEIFLLYKNDSNTSTIVKNNFGQAGVVISGVINMALMYALLSLYLTGGADLLSKTVFPVINLQVSHKISLMFFLIIFLPIFYKGASLVVKSNKVIFYIKIFTFLTTLISGLAFISKDLDAFVIEQLKYIPRALPIFFGALWFHFVIPVIARINNYDRKSCHKVFAVGLTIPVIVYILWIGVMLSLIPRDGVGHSFFVLLSKKESVGTMISYAIANNSHIPHLTKISLNLFSNFALLTSFLVVGLSTYDYIRDALVIKQTTLGITKTLILTLLAPGIFALFFPNGFVVILQQAVILLTLTNVIILLCSLKEYHRLEYKPNKLFIYILLLLLFTIIGLQVLDNFSLLPSYGVSSGLFNK